MPLVKLQFNAGINRETTGYANAGGWWDCDKVRFRQGYPEKIGGWQKFSTAALLGTTRHILPWIALDANQQVGFGTHLKYYVYANGSYTDITPLRETTAAGAVTFLAAYSTLSSGITASDTTLTVASGANFPTTGRIKIGTEEMVYASKSGNVLEGLERGVNGTTAQSHSSSAPVGCATVTVTDTNHGAVAGDFVTFSGAASLGGNMTAVRLNQEYQIDLVLTADTYTLSVREVADIQSITTSSGLSPTYVYSSAADTGTGGASTVGAYQINVGLDTSVGGTGWGAGPWGIGGWGLASSVTTAGSQIRLWSGDNYGEDAIINVRDGGVYLWDKSAGTRATPIYTMAGAQSAPRVARQVIVSDNDRHVIAFGCDDEFNAGVQDPLLIRFSSQENFLEWRSLPTTTAGSLRVGSGSGIICAVETKQQVLVFTDVSVHAMQYLGPPFTFGISMLSSTVSIAGPNAALNVDDTVYWMGDGEFYAYNGVVSRLPCSVNDYVFSDINVSQMDKVYCGANPMFGEVWWFYPSADSDENNRYVVFNYQQNIWYIGSMTRTAWTHRNEGQSPLAVGTDNYPYLHEVGTDDGSENPSLPLPAYIQSSYQEIGAGDGYAFISKVIPDLTFRNSTLTPTVFMSVSASNFPATNFVEPASSDGQTQSDSGSVIRTATVPVQQFTQQLYFRLRGRSFAFRMESLDEGVEWRMGAPRIEIRTDGRR